MSSRLRSAGTSHCSSTLSGGTTNLAGPAVTAANVSGAALVNVNAANSVLAGGGVEGGQELLLGDGDRDLVVTDLDAEVAGQTAAAREPLHRHAGRGEQGRGFRQPMQCAVLDGGHEVNEVFFDNVEVPVENRIGDENKGWTYAKFLLGHERVGIARVPAAKKALRRLKEIARSEQANGRSLIEDLRFRDRIAQIEIDLTALEITLLRVLTADDLTI